MTGEQFKIEVVPLKSKLYRFAKRFLEDHEDAQDIVQDVFIKLWNRRDKLDEYRSVEALAMVTTRNMCLDRLKSKKYPGESIENLSVEPQVEVADTKEEQTEMVSRVKIIIRSLPELQQTIIHLRDIEGYEFEEIASMLKMNENAIRVNLSRARKKVRELMIIHQSHEYQRN